MIGQGDQASNQYGFYAVPKALEPKRKYREEYEDQNEYSEEELDDDNQFQTIDRQPQNQRQLERDYYVDEAPYPQFKPKQRGLDYGVQIQRHQLFDFDLEVQPLIQILVGRSVVSAINELQEEKQLTERQAARDKYDKKRNAQLMVTQRLQTKNKRKKEQTDRRKLQKQVFVKNKKLGTKKIIARTNAKHCLLNIKQEVLEELEQDGYLRQSTYLGMRVQYQGWLYQQIKAMLDDQAKIKNAAEKMIKEKENQIKSEHQKFIDKENKRRKDILDERERVRKAEEQRRMKKRIRKQRLQINSERIQNEGKATEEVNKYEHVDKILKNPSIGNGFTKSKNTPDTVHISGGLFNFIVAYLASRDVDIDQAEVQNIFKTLLNELQANLEIPFSQEHLAQIQKAKATLDQNAIAFMKNKQENVKELIKKICLDLSLLERAGISIKSSLHNNILLTILSIILNRLPQPKMEGQQVIESYEATDKDKAREQLKQKIILVSQNSSAAEQRKTVNNVVRVRFQKIAPESESQKKQEGSEAPKEEKEQQKKQVDLDEWIDIFDGEGWSKRYKGDEKDCQREEQTAASYSLTGFDNTLVLDERNLYYLHQELQKIIQNKAGDKFNNYKESLMREEEKIPVYDIPIEWQ